MHDNAVVSSSSGHLEFRRAAADACVRRGIAAGVALVIAAGGGLRALGAGADTVWALLFLALPMMRLGREAVLLAYGSRPAAASRPLQVRRSSRRPGVIAIPVIIRTHQDAREALLAGVAAAAAGAKAGLAVCLLVDFADAEEREPASDAALLLSLEEERQILAAPFEDRIAVLVRRRRWSSPEKLWTGWERKRGKLIEFLRMLRGSPGAFSALGVMPPELPQVDFVVTLDVDARIDQHSLGRLCDCASSTLDSGASIGILTPRIESRLPPSPTVFQRWITTSPQRPPGEPACSPWQAAFGRDLFVGKGVLLVDRFLESVRSLPENTLLSHDHIEGFLAGTIQVSKCVVSEPQPTSWPEWRTRQSRWIRGDAQLMIWALGAAMRGHLRLAPLYTAKIIDNIVDHATAPLTVGFSFAVWLGAIDLHPFWGVAALALLNPPLLLAFGRDLWRGRSLSPTIRLLSFQVLTALDGSVSAITALARAGLRAATERKRLEWRGQDSRTDLQSTVGLMSVSLLLSVSSLIALALYGSPAVVWAGPLLLAWTTAPWILWRMSRSTAALP